MQVQFLAPGVQHRHKADVGAKMLGIAAQLQHTLGRRLEEQAIDQPLILQGHQAKDGRQGKDDMEVGHGQQLRGALVQPLGPSRRLALGAVAIAAGVVGDALVATLVTLLQVAPNTAVRQHTRSCSTRLCSAELLPSALQEGRRVVPQDVGQFQPFSGHAFDLPSSKAPRRSKGLGVPAIRSTETKVYRAVVRRLRWPSRAWMVRRSTPASSRCVAKE